MSYLDGPRINFWGGAKTNVDTANNSENGFFDMVRASVVSSDTDEQIIEALRQPTEQNHQPYFTRAGWNYYGDHQVAFMDAQVSSSGQPGSVSTEGELAGQPIFLLGSIDPQSGSGPYGGPVMVDLDPTSGQATQIFVGGLQIGTGEKPALLVRSDTRCHSRFIGRRYDSNSTHPPFATPGSAFFNGTFQVAFPKAGIEADPDCQILADILGTPKAIGMVVRFSFFEFYPGLDTTAIQEGYAANRNPDNPSLGRVIGTIGPWLEGEPATCPPGRLLENQNLGGAQGLAHLDSQSQRLTLDLVSALQGLAIRQDSQGNTAPIGPNVDYGDLSISTQGQPPVATTPSLPDTYYLYGGIYDVDVGAGGASQLETAAIRIGSSKMGLSIIESEIRIFGDPRNIYLDEVGGSTTLDLFVRELGGPVTKATTLSLDTSRSGGLPDPEFLQYPSSVVVPQGEDSVQIEVSERMDRMAGFLALDLTEGGSNGASYFINFRKYSHDDYTDTIEKGDIPWQKVYDTCLRYFYLIFPAMSRRIPLNDEATITATAGEILKRISDPYRPTSLYMPLTRALSPGKIELLRAYLEQVSKKPAP